jgi:hypothetical protein
LKLTAEIFRATFFIVVGLEKSWRSSPAQFPKCG